MTCVCYIPCKSVLNLFASSFFHFLFMVVMFSICCSNLFGLFNILTKNVDNKATLAFMGVLALMSMGIGDDMKISAHCHRPKDQVQLSSEVFA